MATPTGTLQSMKDSPFRGVARGLGYPEGPVYRPDGSVLVVEISAGCLARIAPDGTRTEVAQLGGGPNGAAIGLDVAVYVCNDGGFSFREIADIQVALDQPPNYS